MHKYTNSLLRILKNIGGYEKQIEKIREFYRDDCFHDIAYLFSQKQIGEIILYLVFKSNGVYASDMMVFIIEELYPITKENAEIYLAAAEITNFLWVPGHSRKTFEDLFKIFGMSYRKFYDKARKQYPHRAVISPVFPTHKECVEFWQENFFDKIGYEWVD